VTVNDTAQTVTGVQDGIVAQQLSGGTGDVVINIGTAGDAVAATAITGNTGIFAKQTGAGTIEITNYGTITGTTGVAIGLNLAAGDTATIIDYGAISSATSLNFANAANTTVNFTASGGAANVSVTSATGGINVGYGGTETWTIENGAQVTSSFLNIGQQAGSTGTVTVEGAGTQLSLTSGNFQDILDGNLGSGTLIIQAGATVNSSALNLGQQAGSTGTVIVQGVGTALTLTSGQNQDILDGNSGTASLIIQNQASVSVTNITIANNSVAGVTDTLVVDDATLNVANHFTFGAVGCGYCHGPGKFQYSR
jgi:T5SS/PEP-CTERM-associated repeat protein